ncbi:hypothetical protein TgHK011_004492 [Trichoderma gracile]|nr:hypothetical protein TgHK011_004492 [Trichoderma gracile]
MHEALTLSYQSSTIGEVANKHCCAAAARLWGPIRIETQDVATTEARKVKVKAWCGAQGSRVDQRSSAEQAQHQEPLSKLALCFV